MGTAQLRAHPTALAYVTMFAQGQSLQGGFYADICRAGPRDRNDAGRRVRAGADLRSEFPDLPADLWPQRRLYCVWLYIDGPVQIVRIRPRGAVHHQPIFRRTKFGPSAAPTP